MTLSKLTLQYDTQIKAELEAREIVLPKPFEDLKQAEKKDLLKRDEMKVLAAADKAKEGIAKDKVTEIVPVSDEMIALMNEWHASSTGANESDAIITEQVTFERQNSSLQIYNRYQIKSAHIQLLNQCYLEN